MKSFARPHIFAAAGLAALTVASQARAQAAPPPSVDQIKACVKQIDPANRWTFDWKTVQIGAPRAPRDNYEQANLAGLGARAERLGYPVHAVYRLGDLTTIDANYWLIQNANGKWQIPLLCTVP